MLIASDAEFAELIKSEKNEKKKKIGGLMVKCSSVQWNVKPSFTFANHGAGITKLWVMKKQVGGKQFAPANNMTIYKDSHHFKLCHDEVNGTETTSDLLCADTFLLTFCNLTLKLCLWNNIR